MHCRAPVYNGAQSLEILCFIEFSQQGFRAQFRTDPLERIHQRFRKHNAGGVENAETLFRCVFLGSRAIFIHQRMIHIGRQADSAGDDAFPQPTGNLVHQRKIHQRVGTNPLRFKSDGCGSFQRDCRRGGIDPQKSHFRAGIFQSQHLRGKIFFAGFNGYLFDKFHLIRIQASLAALEAALAICVVLIQESDFFGFQFFHRIFGQNAGLIIIESIHGKEVRIDGKHILVNGCRRIDPDDFILRQIIFHGHSAGSTDAAHKSKNSLTLDKFLDHGFSLGGVVLIIADEIFDFTSVDAAFIVDNLKQKAAPSGDRSPGCGRSRLRPPLGDTDFLVVKARFGLGKNKKRSNKNSDDNRQCNDESFHSDLHALMSLDK